MPEEQENHRNGHSETHAGQIQQDRGQQKQDIDAGQQGEGGPPSGGSAGPGQQDRNRRDGARQGGDTCEDQQDQQDPQNQQGGGQQGGSDNSNRQQNQQEQQGRQGAERGAEGENGQT